MATQAAWMRAFSETDFSALTNGVPPATLDHESLLGLGLKKCSDRKAILRRYSKTCTHHHISSKIDCTAKVYAANAEGSPGATINDLQTITFFFSFLSFLSGRLPSQNLKVGNHARKKHHYHCLPGVTAVEVEVLQQLCQRLSGEQRFLWCAHVVSCDSSLVVVVG